eukprot:scaffold368950_cov33-Prasinocladus_malaysianus.AAC.1
MINKNEKKRTRTDFLGILTVSCIQDELTSLSLISQAGATTLNIPDTTGWNLPAEFGGLIASIKANTPGVENVVISTHCQNDLGLSTANSLAGAMNGARQIECTINGIGERAGNASLEEVAMAIALKG